MERRTDDQRQPSRTREELELLAAREILHASASGLPLEAILTTIVNILITVAHVSTAWLMLVERGSLRTTTARGERAEVLRGSICSDPAHPCYAVAAGEQPQILDPHELDPADPVLGSLAGRRCVVVLLPLRASGHTVGVLGAAVPPESMPGLSLLSLLATEAATAIASANRPTQIRTWQHTLDTALGQIAEPVLVFDREGRLALWNGAAEELLGERGIQIGDTIAYLAARARLGDAQGNLLVPSDSAAARALRGERVENLEVGLPARDGGMRYLLASATPLQADGTVQGAVEVWRDVTHIRQLERMRAEFLSAVGHQLRTPLTSVLGFAEFLERKANTGISDEELKKGLRTIAEQARRINALVTDLIDGSQAEAGHLRLEMRTFDLTGLIQSVLSRFRSAEPAYTFRAEMPAALPPVRADPKRIERVLRNLLSNAVKFSPAGTEIVLRAAADRTRVTVSIADHGFGIAREDIPAVFMPFYRTPQVKGHGVGLGLFMARAIVEAHGGAMWVQSQVGEGSTFYFSLPIAHPC